MVSEGTHRPRARRRLPACRKKLPDDRRGAKLRGAGPPGYGRGEALFVLQKTSASSEGGSPRKGGEVLKGEVKSSESSIF